MLKAAGFILLAVLFLACFFGAPAALARVNLRMAELGLLPVDVDKAYGALSTMLSGIATIGVALALAFQVRQIKISRVHAIRMMQIELMSMLISNTELRPTSTLGDITQEQRRRDIYSNLILRYLEMGFETGHFTDRSIRLELISQFAIEDIRRFWEHARPGYVAGVQNKAQERFVGLVDEAYETSPPAATRPTQARQQSPDLSRLLQATQCRRAVATLLCLAASAAVVTRITHRRRTTHRHGSV